MRNNKFKNLVDKYLKGLLQKEEEEHLERWADSLEDKHAFDALPESEVEDAGKEIYNRLMTRINKADKPPVVFIRKPLVRIAASVAVLIIAGFLFKQDLLNIIAPHRQTYVISMEGHIRKQILSDGTIVWLKGHSRLVFPVKFGNSDRAVTLEGEALFEVAKDAGHPFVIHCGTLITKVLGTSFNIRNTGAKTEVAVLTGQVALTTATAERILLNPNEKAIYSEPFETIEKDNGTGTQAHDFIKGTEYDMSFNDAGMPDVIQRVEKKFEVDIKVEDATIMSNLITADLTDQSLQNTMKMISQALNLDVDIKGKTVLLQPKRKI